MLILDDSTSALDMETEYEIQKSLESLEATKIIIAHRISAVRRADEIIFLEDGRIKERGTHEELHPQRPGHQGLHPGQAAVLAQIIQGLQHEKGLHPLQVRLHLVHHLPEGRPGPGQLPDKEGRLGLLGGSGAGVEDMDLPPAALLPVDGAGLHGGVVGPGEPPGEGDHIVVPVAEVLQIGGRGGAGGLGPAGGGAHLLQQHRLPELLVIGHGLRAHMDAQRHHGKVRVPPQVRRRVRTAVTDQAITHLKNHLN